MSRILLVDDALDDQRIVSSALSKDYQLSIASNLADARLRIAAEEFDLILLDVQLPDGDGFVLCAELQSDEHTRAIPIFFLTVRSSIQDKVLGFSVGAEDYISKPFAPEELLARIKARIRKAGERISQDLVLQLGDLKISVSKQKVYFKGRKREELLDLTPLEFKLLFYFARHEEHVFSREQLLEAVWADNVNVLDRTVDMHVSNLRKKLSPSSWTIRSVHGVGYRFAPTTQAIDNTN
jgi:two-component system phosphate regulon response regulator PhoB